MYVSNWNIFDQNQLNSRKYILWFYHLLAFPWNEISLINKNVVEIFFPWRILILDQGQNYTRENLSTSHSTNTQNLYILRKLLIGKKWLSVSNHVLGIIPWQLCVYVLRVKRMKLDGAFSNALNSYQISNLCYHNVSTQKR